MCPTCFPVFALFTIVLSHELRIISFRIIEKLKGKLELGHLNGKRRKTKSCMGKMSIVLNTCFPSKCALRRLFFVRGIRVFYAFFIHCGSHTI